MNATELKDKRKKAKLTQEDLAEMIGVNRRTIINYENGEGIPLANVKLLHRIFNEMENNITIQDTGDISHNTIIGGIKNVNAPARGVVEADEVINYEKGIPYYNVDFINGFTGVEEITHQNADYNINYPPANHCQFWVNATGESMKGVIDNGDKIALKQVDIEWFPLGEVYAIVTTNGHRMVKKIVKSNDDNCYKLISSNPNKVEYPDQDIPKKMIQTLFKVVTAIKIIN